MGFGNFRIATKIFFVIGVLAVVCGTITVTAVVGFRQLNAATDAVAMVAQEIRLSSRANRLIAELNRDEFSVAADPSLYAEAASSIAERRAGVADALRDLRQTADGNQTNLLDTIEARLAAYTAGLDRTLETAHTADGTVTLSDTQKALVDAVTASRQQARALRESITAFVDYTERRAATISAAADELARSRTTLLVTVAAIGILFGLALGWVVAQKGVVQPIRAI
uniref:MCP four helix bundle domain-containing protein n=1 Tax=Azospirillum halopraeferens TaxID=34010 RepID=UPI00048E2D1C